MTENDRNKNYGRNRENITNDWPQPGISVNDLYRKKKYTVVLDSDFIKTPAFYYYSLVWHSLMSEVNPDRKFIVPACEEQKLSLEEKLRLDGNDCIIMNCTDWNGFFQTLRGIESWFILLTVNGDNGKKIRDIASKSALKLRWYGLDKNGCLCTLPISDYQAKKNYENNVFSNNSGKIFKITDNRAPIGRAMRAPKRIPQKGAVVSTIFSNREVVLGDALMTDHISVTYSTNDSRYFAKIYTADALSLDIFEKKAERMVQEPIDIPGVCWPKDKLVDQAGCFVGVLVPASKGIQLTRSVLNGATGLSRYCRGWDRYNLCVLTVTILDMICRMHEKGIYFGCINPSSIYVSGDAKVFFVDTDCWQIEGYPALSQNQTFTPPEILKDNKKVFLYTEDQENYQVAVLIFMLLMPGKFPYAKMNRENERDSIINQSFPFSIGGGMRHSKDAERPSGIWRIVWDHLPYRICNAFYNTFHETGKYAVPGKRISAYTWYKMAEEYRKEYEIQDKSLSREIFPQTFRRDGKRHFVRCSVCGKEHPDFYFMHSIRIQGEKIDIWNRGYRICLPCADDKSDVSFICQSCGKEYFYTNRTKVLHEIGKSDFDYKNQKWCRECKNQKVRCAKCGQEVQAYQIRDFEDRNRGTHIKLCGKCFHEAVEQAKQERQERQRRKKHFW